MPPSSIVKQISIYVCDASKAVSTTLARALTHRGVHVAGDFVTFDELLSAALDDEVDVILLHFNVPGPRGPEAVAALRAQGIETPIIITSGDETNEKPSLHAGAAGFFYKDFRNIEQLAEAINRLGGAA